MTRATRNVATTVLMLAALPALAQSTCVQWEQKATGGPPSIYCHAGVYDAWRGVTVLFGGNNGCSVGGTYEWNGAGWIRVQPSVSPSSRSSFDMAFDLNRGVTVLFGGNADCGGPTYRDTWEYNGVDWTRIMSTNGLAPPAQGTMCFDPVRNQVVLAVCCGFRQTWAWDGSAWSLITSGAPYPAEGGSIVFDEDAGVLRLFAQVRRGSEWFGQLLSLVNGVWQLDHEFNANRSYWIESEVIYSPVRRSLIRYDRNIHSVSETYEWTGTDWVRLTTTEPPNRVCTFFEYDTNRNVAVMFGGHDEIGLRSDTWELRLGSAVTVDSHPQDRSLLAGATASFEVSASATETITYRWRRNGTALVNGGRVSGATSSRLQIRGIEPSDAGLYDVLVSVPSCSEVSRGARLNVICPTDFNLDGTVDFFDYLDFASAYATEDGTADFSGDGQVDFFDYLDFVTAFDAGC
ncbi:MAG: immunoglobulin domain-containing protein [Planctomycetota bacterium]|nr:immunoglobulin domain-containing protein [Planctomycetota bacterium]